MTPQEAVAAGVPVPDFVPLADVLEFFEPPPDEMGAIPATPQRKRRLEFADERTLPPCRPGDWLVAAKARRPRREWHAVADYLRRHADWETGRGVRCSIARMAEQIGKKRANCQQHVKRLRDEGWLVPTGKAKLGVIVYALAVPLSVELGHKLNNSSMPVWRVEGDHG